MSQLSGLAKRLVADGRWDEAVLRCGEFADAIRRHFAREENLLFPAFEDATGMSGGPTVTYSAQEGWVSAFGLQRRKLVVSQAETPMPAAMKTMARDIGPTSGRDRVPSERR